MTDAVTRDQVVAAARAFIGTPWKHQGRRRGVGVDCIGLIGGVASALALPGADEWATDQSLHCYGRTPVAAMLLDACDRFLRRVRLADVQPADVLVMGFQNGPQHFAIVSRLAPTYIVHAYAQRRAVIETQAALPGAQILRAYAFNGVR